jgi:hypothetical protein
MTSFHSYVLGCERSEARNRVLQENIHRRLHKTPRGVCRTRNWVDKSSVIRLTDECRLKGLFGCLSCGALCGGHFSTNG